MGGGTKKRAADEISPTDKKNKGQNKRQTNMATSKNKNTSQQGTNLTQQIVTPAQTSKLNHSSQPILNPNVNPGSQANQANQSYSLPPVYQYQQPYMAMGMNPISPVFSQSTPQFTGVTPGNVTPENDTFQTILARLESLDSRLENMNGRLNQLDQITTKVNSITCRLDSMDKKLCDLESSQTYISNQYDDMSSNMKEVTLSVKNLESKISVLETENSKILQEKESLKDAIVDLKCRSMRDNMLFFGLPENNGLPISITPSDSSDSTPVNSAQSSNSYIPSENCEEKVLQFCENVLKIENPKQVIGIDRAHRIGGRVQGKIRPIVVKFKDTRSKTIVKDALRNVNLRNSPYNVSEQFPPEVQEKRKQLFPVMSDARKSGKRAVLVRDKLYINNKLYDPTKKND